MIDSEAHGGTALRFVTNFEYKYGQELLKLAYHAALPVVVNADLIHLLRINFFLDVSEPLPFTAEADLLLSSLCYDIGDGLYEISPNIRNVLLQRLVKEYPQERVREIATLLWQYTEQYAPWVDRPELERAQQLTALNFLDPLKAKQWLEEAEKSLGPAPSVEREWFVAMWKEMKQISELSANVSRYNLLVGISELKLADLGEGMQGAEVIEWLVKEGDTIKLDQTIVKVETEKAIIEIPSPVNGRISQIRVKSGQTAKVGDVLVVFEAIDVDKEFKFGELLSQFRIRAGMTQQALADRLGIHRRTISAWENSNSLPKNRSRVLELARALRLNEQDTNRLLNLGFGAGDSKNASTALPFGELLKEYRKRQGMTQKALGEKLNVHRATIADWEGGNYLPKTREKVLEVAGALSLNIEDTNSLLLASLFPTADSETQVAQLRVLDEAHNKLDGSQLEQLRTALLSAYSSQEMLSQMVRIKLNKDLDTIAQDKLHQNMIFNLISRAQAEGWIRELITAAYEFMPDNQMLKVVYERFVLGRVEEVHPQVITVDNKLSGAQQTSLKEKSKSEFLASKEINQIRTQQGKRKWPGVDDKAVVKEMLQNPNSEHWTECRKFMTSLVLQEASRNIPADMLDEIVQNAMVSVFTGLAQFRFEGKLTTWLAAIARSRVIDLQRRLARTTGLELNPEDPSVMKEYEANRFAVYLSEYIEKSSLSRETIEEAFSILQTYVRNRSHPERDRDILQMVLFEGYTYEETAEVLNVSAPVVGYVVREAQRYLRDRLKY